MAIPFIIVIILVIGLLFRLTPNYIYQNTITSKIIRVLLTNWIHFAGICLATGLATFINNFVDHGKNIHYTKASAIEILLGAFMMFIAFAIKYIGLALLIIFITDLLALAFRLTRTIILVLIQWLVISAFAIYYILHGMDKTFSTLLIIAFLITQLLRAKQLKKIIETLPVKTQ